MTANGQPSYVHRDKVCAHGGIIAAGEARLKWYEIGYPEVAIDSGVRQRAKALIESLSLPAELGFVILHRCGGPGFHFLLVQTWRNDNELWETVYAKHDDADPGFSLFPLPDPHRGTFCVWELGVVWREQLAWRRFLLSARDDAAKAAYLAEIYEGDV
jgi:hypothetical protein